VNKNEATKNAKSVFELHWKKNEVRKKLKKVFLNFKVKK
jgi:hypothetical protein